MIKNKFNSKVSIPILIVDDNDFNLEVLRSYTKKLELKNAFILDEATNGRQAINMFITRSKTDNPYRLILMDCEMPIMDGVEATKEIIVLIKEQNLKKCNIIALTAHDEERINGNNIFQHILRKPLSIGQFTQIFLSDFLFA